MFPSDPKGSAGEVINCRCALLQRARWSLDDDELARLEEQQNILVLIRPTISKTSKKNILESLKKILKRMTM